MRKRVLSSLLCVALVFSNVVPGMAANENPALETEVTTKEDSTKEVVSFEAGEKVCDGSVKVVNLSGTWREMGRQYGELLQEELQEIYDFTMDIANASEDNQAKAQSIKEMQANQCSYNVREFMAGAAETSELTEDQLQVANAVERISGLPNCSAMMAWDDYAKDELIVGRNYDYSEQFKELKDDIAVTVYHPADGSLATATIGYVGEIYAVNAMNEKGIFLELNNGTPSIKSKPEVPFITGTSLLFDLMFQADSLDYADLFFNTTLCSSSYIINMADSQEARSYEWCVQGAKSGGNTLENGLLVSTNHYLDEEWGFETPTDENSWNSLTRRDNLIQLAETNKGQIDASKMMEIMDTKYEDGGATEDMTVYQLVVEPETLTLWLKITDGADWTKIDLTDYFSEKEKMTEDNKEKAADNKEKTADNKGKATDNQDKTAEDYVAQMTLEEKIGQMIMPAFRSWVPEGSEAEDAENVIVLNEQIRQEIEESGFGGIILFAENFVDEEQTIRLIQDMQSASADGGHLPLLIATDQEGGRVARLNTGTTMGGNMPLGAIGSADEERGKEAAYETGSLIGEELAALGINVDFAPDMDVNDNPENPVIGVRSFSDDPALVASLGVSMLEGLQSQNIATALKHFPGHGNTATDSHIGLPVVDKSLEELEKCELISFQAGMDAGTDMVMTAHIQYPQVETTTYTSPLTGNEILLPATLSKTIITDVLRTDMNYDGVVVTDALVMDAIAQNFPMEDFAKLAINADVDILLMPVDTSTEEGLAQLKELIASITEMVKSGEIQESTIDDSAERIIEMKIARNIMDESQYEEEKLDEKITAASEIVGSKEHKQRERALADEAITIVKNEENLIPVTLSEGEKVLVAAYGEDSRKAFAYGFKRLQEEGTIGQDVTFDSLVFHVDEETEETTQAERDQEIQAGVENADVVIVESTIGVLNQLNPEDPEYGWRTAGVDQILNWAKEAGKKVIVASDGLPYDAARYADAATLLAGYCPRGIANEDEDGNPVGFAGPIIPALMDVIFGKAQGEGALPVNIRKLDEQYQITDEILYERGTSYGNSSPHTSTK